MKEHEIDIYRFIISNSNYTSTDFLSMNEAAQLNVGDKIMDKVLAKMMTKYVKIDFGDIPRTQGDFTKFKHYREMVKCLEQLEIMHSVTGKLPETIIIRQALTNVLSLEKSFAKAFKQNNSFGIILYNTICLAIFEGVSLLITTLVEFIQYGKDYEVIIMDNSKSREHLLIKNLVKFNTTVADGSIDKYLGTVTDDTMHESITVAATIAAIKASPLLVKAGITLGGGIATLWAVSRVLPSICKQLIYYYHNSKQNISDSARMQAQFLQTGIEALKLQGGQDKVIAKQEKFVKMFTAIADKFSVKMQRAGKEAETEAANDTVSVDDIDF